MAYDEVLAGRVRDLLADRPGVTERAMFGGLAFMLDGHLAVAAGSGGALMVRADQSARDHPLLEPMVMRGRAMTGWYVTAPGVALGEEDLTGLVDLGCRRVRTLPPKG